MLTKEICQKCAKKYDESLDGFDEFWQEGKVGCPKVLVAKKMIYKGKKIDCSKDKGLKNLFGVIFGMRSTDDLPPPWCPFGSDHYLTDLKKNM